MREESDAMQAFGRAGRRAVYHLLQAAVEGLKAVEAVIEEVGGIGDKDDADTADGTRKKIDIE